jgi:hypothetical protein
MRGSHNKLGKGERKVRLGQDSLPNSEFPCQMASFRSGNSRKVAPLFYLHPLFRPSGATYTKRCLTFNSISAFFHMGHFKVWALPQKILIANSLAIFLSHRTFNLQFLLLTLIYF